jgi:hypothetical protein
MTDYPLQLSEGHLFLEVDGDRWLIDTGAPASFGRSGAVIDKRRFEVSAASAGLDATTLSGMVKVECQGLFGADVLSHFDWILDPGRGVARVSAGELAHQGDRVAVETFMDIPIVEAGIGAGSCRMFFDTGAQISYLGGDRLGAWPARGRTTDFYPGLGEFEVEVHEVEIGLGGARRQVRCGALPALLQGMLTMAGTAGIIGNEILTDRVTGYFPRRRLLVT